MIVEEGKYYLYRHIRLDTNEVFYVGIGTQYDGTNYKRANEKCGRSNFWKGITKKAGYRVEIVLESDDYEFIKEKEIEFIALYGRRNLGNGTLVNLTDGGNGSVGNIMSTETRLRMSIAQENKSEEHKQKISEAHKGSKSHKAKLTEEEAFEIKYGHKNLVQREIAEIYGITIQSVSYIRTNRNWKHI